MEPVTTAALIGAGASLAGGAISGLFGRSNSKREYERQKEFAQNGIRWRVADAKAAGIHPLYAIGSNTPTYSPQAAVGTDFGVSQAGQNIARAIEAKQTREERANAQAIQNEIGQAQADYYRAQADLARTKADLAGQKAVQDALQDIRKDTVGSMAAASQSQLRKQQQQPPIPRTDGNQGFDTPTPRYDFEFGLDGKRVAISHSQTMHDKYEDMFLAEYWPVALGLIADARFKLTREPVMGEDGKWYAYNGEFYAPIDIKTYRYEWENSVYNRYLNRRRGKSYSAGAGITLKNGGGGI